MVKVNWAIFRLHVFPAHDLAEVDDQLTVSFKLVQFTLVLLTHVVRRFRVVCCDVVVVVVVGKKQKSFFE